MTKRVVAFFYVIGVLFWGGMLFSAVFKLLVYGEYFYLFETDKIDTVEYVLKPDSLKSNSLDLFYSYVVDHKVYNKRLDVLESYFNEHVHFSKDSLLEVTYVKLLPHMSYISSLALEKRKAKTGVVIAFFFLVFISVLYGLARRKWR